MVRWRRRLISPLALVLLGHAGAAWADEQKQAPPPENTSITPAEGAKPASPEHVAEVVVKGEKAGSEAASRLNVTRRELELRPRLRPGDILEAAPGLFAVQHAGGGQGESVFFARF